jgi:hypothetical protein
VWRDTNTCDEHEHFAADTRSLQERMVAHNHGETEQTPIRFSHCAAAQQRFAADALLAFARIAQLKPGTLDRLP